MIKDRYVKFFKGEIIVLLILLVVVCFSFGVTYSNFIYNSENKRAVEMFTGELKYNISINSTTANKVTVKPGNNYIALSITSLNSVDSYYKLIIDNENVNATYYNKNDNNIIKSNDGIILSLIIFNKTDKNIDVDFKVVGGFITNKLEDVIVPSGFTEVYKNVNTGDYFTFNNDKYRLLNINLDGTYELLSDSISNVITSGHTGYNKYISLINENIIDIDKSIYTRAINIEDISRYIKNKNLVSYSDSKTYGLAYYPTLWGYESGSIINEENTNGIISKSEEFNVEDGYNLSDSISVPSIKIENIEYNKPIYKEIFENSNYYIGTRCTKTNDTNAYFGVLYMNDGVISCISLYDSNSNNYETNNNVRSIVLLPNTYNLFYEEL